jgi:hypothetical protein
MKLPSLTIAALAISILFASSLPVNARPVTTADLSGKIICWDGGVIQNFEADGKSADTRNYSDATWSVGPKGVRLDWSGGGADIDIEIQPDGTVTVEYTDDGGTHKRTGKMCKREPLHYADLEGKKLCYPGQDGQVETYFPGGKFINSVDGEGVLNFNGDNGLVEWKFKKYDKVFKGKFGRLEDGTLLYTGSWAGTDYGLADAVFCK